MKKLKLYLTIFVTGLLAGLTLFFHLFRSSETDSELLQLENEGANLENDINALEDELDSLEVDDLDLGQAEDYWKDEL